MKIDDNHMYHGAALLQIAEDPRFTAINAIEISGEKSRSAYLINTNIGIFLKYASKPSGTGPEYSFNFTDDHLQELNEVAGKVRKTFIALVCVEDRQIACLDLPNLKELIKLRRKERGADEEQSIVFVRVPQRRKLRVYVSVPGRRKTILEKEILVARTDFPGILFD